PLPKSRGNAATHARAIDLVTAARYGLRNAAVQARAVNSAGTASSGREACIRYAKQQSNCRSRRRNEPDYVFPPNAVVDDVAFILCSCRRGNGLQPRKPGRARLPAGWAARWLRPPLTTGITGMISP